MHVGITGVPGWASRPPSRHSACTSSSRATGRGAAVDRRRQGPEARSSETRRGCAACRSHRCLHPAVTARSGTWAEWRRPPGKRSCCSRRGLRRSHSSRRLVRAVEVTVREHGRHLRVSHLGTPGDQLQGIKEGRPGNWPTSSWSTRQMASTPSKRRPLHVKLAGGYPMLYPRDTLWRPPVLTNERAGSVGLSEMWTRWSSTVTC